MNSRLLRFVRGLAGDAVGATAIEYGLIVALITLGAFAAINGLAGTTTSLWNRLDSRVADVT